MNQKSPSINDVLDPSYPGLLFFIRTLSTDLKMDRCSNYGSIEK